MPIDGHRYAMLDRNFPTIDWSDPYALSPEEEECMAQLRHSFLQSQTLRDQMRYVENKGTMYLVRDYNLIFHGCVPVDRIGQFPSPQSRWRGVSGTGAFRRAQPGGSSRVPSQGAAPSRHALVPVVRSAIATFRKG